MLITNTWVCDEIERLNDQGIQQLSNPKRAIFFFEEAIAIASEICLESRSEADLGRATTESHLSYLYYQQAQHEKSLYYGLAAIDRYRHLTEKPYLPMTTLAVANSYHALGSTAKCIKYGLLAIEVSRKADDLDRCARANHIIAVAYNLAGDKTRAIAYETKGFDLCIQTGDKHGQIRALNNMCHHSIEAKMIDDALKYALKAEEISKGLTDLHPVPHCILHANLFRAMRQIKEQDAGQYHLSKINEINTQSTIPLVNAVANFCFGIDAQDSQRYKDAESHFLLTVAKAEEASLIHIQTEILESLIGLYEEIGDFEKALRFQKQFHAMRENLKMGCLLQSVESLAEVRERAESKELLYESEILHLKTVVLERMVDERTAKLEESLGREQNLLKSVDIARDQVQSFDQFRADIIDNVSHEFRTSLAIIGNSANLLEQFGERLPSDKKIIQFENIKKSLDNLTRLVSNVEKVGQRPSILPPSNVKSYELAYLCSQLAEEWTAELNALRLKTDFAESLFDVEIEIDYATVYQIGKDLISNALKYSDSDVQIVFSSQNNQFTITIIDSGIGILPNEKDAIFDLLKRGSNVNARSGLGIGLFISKDMAEKIGGTITAYSDGEGEGTQFTLALPLSSPYFKPHFKKEEDTVTEKPPTLN